MDLLQRIKHEKRRKDRLKLIKLDQKVNSFCKDVEQFKTNMSLEGFYISVPEVFWGILVWWNGRSANHPYFSLLNIHIYRIIIQISVNFYFITGILMLYKECPMGLLHEFWAGIILHINNFSSHHWWWSWILARCTSKYGYTDAVSDNISMEHNNLFLRDHDNLESSSRFSDMEIRR